MFTQRKTNSYDLVGTNARNSDCSFSSSTYPNYGQNMIERFSLEKSEQGSNQLNIDTIFSNPSEQRNACLSRQSNQEDLVDQILINNHQRSSNIGAVSDRDRDFYSGPKITLNMNGLDVTPFEQFNNFYFGGFEDSTNESGLTSGYNSGLSSGFVLSANNSDLEELINSEEKLEKLMADLDSIDQPLS